MHYGKTAFGGGRLTIRTKDPSMQNVIGNRQGFSEIDKKQINLMYCGGNVSIDLSFVCKTRHVFRILFKLNSVPHSGRILSFLLFVKFVLLSKPWFHDRRSIVNNTFARFTITSRLKQTTIFFWWCSTITLAKFLGYCNTLDKNKAPVFLC